MQDSSKAGAHILCTSALPVGVSHAGIPANSIVLGQPSNAFRSTAALAECGSLQVRPRPMLTGD